MRVLVHLRGFHRSLKRPILKPSVKRRVAYADDSGPLRKGMGLASIFNNPVIPSIIRLLSHCRPATIAGFIVAVVVDAIYGVFWGWARPHIVVKNLERINPFVTNLYATASIIFIGMIVGIGTTQFHTLPNVVFRCITHAVGSQMLIGHACCPLSLKTAATSSCSPFKAVGAHLFYGSAIASAKPIVMFSFPTRKGKNRPTVELFTDKVLNFWGNGVRLIFSHFATPFSVLVRETVSVSALAVSCFVHTDYNRTPVRNQMRSAIPAQAV
jgi:hypothetical protein